MNIAYYALNKDGEVENRLPRKDDVEALAVIQARDGEHLYAEDKVRETFMELVGPNEGGESVTWSYAHLPAFEELHPNVLAAFDDILDITREDIDIAPLRESARVLRYLLDGEYAIEDADTVRAAARGLNVIGRGLKPDDVRRCIRAHIGDRT